MKPLFSFSSLVSNGQRQSISRTPLNETNIYLELFHLVNSASITLLQMKSHLPNTELALIWRLADVDGDGYLDLEQWALANHLVRVRLEGHQLPHTLPNHLTPPSLKSAASEK